MGLAGYPGPTPVAMAQDSRRGPGATLIEPFSNT